MEGDKNFEGTKPLFEITHWSSVAVWAFEGSPTCSICRNDFTDPCIECQSKKQNEPKDITAEQLLDDRSRCPLVVGKCGHRFHKHCISNWLAKRSTCPLDNTTWVEASTS